MEGVLDLGVVSWDLVIFCVVGVSSERLDLV